MESPALPERLRQYEISERLSRDGKQRTYLALDTRSQRSVTLKTVRTSPDDREVAAIAAQLRNQATVSAGLKHPGILEVYEYGEDAGIAFLALEFVQGCFFKPGLRMPLGDASSAILQLLDALDYAQRRSVVHLDIQPACLLLTSKGQLRITDFGTAADKPRVLAYAAPERLRGQSADSRADIFSAGAWFYELLTGKAPFGSSVEGIVERIARLKEQPASQADSKIPAVFDAVLGKALAKEPGERFTSAGEFANELRRAFESACGGSPKEMLSNETVVSVFLASLRGESRKAGSKQPSPPPAITPKSKIAWTEETLKAVEYQLAPFIGAVAGVVVRNASHRADSLEDLYRLAAESLESTQDRQAFLAGRVRASGASGPKPSSRASAKAAESVNANLSPGAVRGQGEAFRLKSPEQGQSLKPPLPSAPRGARNAARMEELPLGHADSLEDYLTDQPAEVEEVATAFISATEALAAFYASNGKSGGLAPESIRFDKTGKASIRSSTSTSPQGATCFGSFGSPQYAPPEIFKETDKGNTSVSSSDIYSLGFMFYEILLGRKLFRQTFSSQRTDLDWLRWHADAKAKAPTLKSVLPTRSAALSELLESMMEKDMERRPLDFAQIATKLRAVEVHSNRTMIGPSASLNHASKDLAARNAGGRGSKIAAIVIALLLLGIVIWQAPTLYQWVASRVSAPAQPPSAR